MVSIGKKKHSKRKLLSQLDDFDQDIIFGNAASERQENIIVNEGTNDRDFTVGTSSINLATNENTVNVKTLERCCNKRIDREMSNIVDTVEDIIQIAISTTIDSIVATKIKLAIRSINASSGRDATIVMASSERGEHVGIHAPFENASGNNNVLHVSNMNDETRNKIPEELSELSVPETPFDRQTHTHHKDVGLYLIGKERKTRVFVKGLAPRNKTTDRNQNSDINFFLYLFSYFMLSVEASSR